MSLTDLISLIVILGLVFFGGAVTVGVVAFLIVPAFRRNIEVAKKFYSFSNVHEREYLAIAQAAGWSYSPQVPRELESAFKPFDEHYPGARKECFLVGRANGQPFLSFELFIYESASRMGARPTYHHFNAVMLTGLEFDLPEFTLDRNPGSGRNVSQKYEITSRSPHAGSIFTTASLARLEAGDVVTVWGNRNAICFMVNGRFEPPDQAKIVELLTLGWNLSETVRLTTPFASVGHRS